MPRRWGTLALVLGACTPTPTVDAGTDPDVLRDGAPPDAAPMDAARRACVGDFDCDDGAFCNGTERCVPSAPMADARGCVAGEVPCPDCDEAARRCVTECEVTPDADGDGYAAMACGGADCADDDPERHPGAPDRCNGRDDDCDSSTDEGAESSCSPEPAATVACEAGACRIAACDAGFGDCDPALPGCETTLGSVEHCGTCGASCPLGGWCEDRACRPRERWIAGLDARVTDLAYDSAGNLVVLGCFSGTIMVGGETLTAPGADTMFVASLDHGYLHRWSHVRAGCLRDLAIGAGDEVYVGAGLGVLALDATGRERWRALLPNGLSSGLAVGFDGSEEAVYASLTFFGGTVTVEGRELVGGPEYNVAYARISTDGELDWVAHAVGAYQDSNTLAAGPGVLYAGGAFSRSATFGPTTLSSSDTSAFVAALDARTGAFRGAARVGPDRGHVTALDATGHRVVAVGSFAGSVVTPTGAVITSDGQDGFAMALDESGGVFVPRWFRAFGGSPRALAEWASHVELDSSGRPTVLGVVHTPADVGSGVVPGTSQDIYVTGLNHDGSTRWSRVIVALFPEYAEASAISPTGEIAFNALNLSPPFGWEGVSRSSAAATLLALDP